MEFHEIIYDATGNKRLIQILNNLREQMYRYRVEYLKDTDSHEKLDGEHQAIYEKYQEWRQRGCMRHGRPAHRQSER